MQKLPRWMKEEQARRECSPDQSPNTWKTCPVRALFAVSIDLEQFDLEDQSGVCWDDRWETTSSICLQVHKFASCVFSFKITYVVGCHQKISFLTKGELGDP